MSADSLARESSRVACQLFGKQEVVYFDWRDLLDCDDLELHRGLYAQRKVPNTESTFLALSLKVGPFTCKHSGCARCIRCTSDLFEESKVR